MRFGGFSDLLTFLLLGLCGWALTGSGSVLRDRKGVRATTDATVGAREAPLLRVCASRDCPVIRTLTDGDHVVYGSAYGYGWTSVEVTDTGGQTVKGVVQILPESGRRPGPRPER